MASAGFFPGIEKADAAPWAATLSYVSTAFGVVVGFSILFCSASSPRRSCRRQRGNLDRHGL
ncbi:MAG: hypothetical protein IPH81_20505 [Candidatus Microthrix sp.]|nr:hypothetical protein [Candidatus Microthrix sp.]